MAKKVKLNKNGFYDLRRAPGVKQDLKRRARAIADACNSTGAGTYDTGGRQGAKKPQGRWRETVLPVDAEARRDNARNNRIVRNLDAGRR